MALSDRAPVFIAVAQQQAIDVVQCHGNDHLKKEFALVTDFLRKPLAPRYFSSQCTSCSDSYLMLDCYHQLVGYLVSRPHPVRLLAMHPHQFPEACPFDTECPVFIFIAAFPLLLDALP